MFARSMLAVALIACASASSAQAAWKEMVFYRFVAEGSGSTLGYNPRLGVLQVGNSLFGVSTNGGSRGGGVVWRRNSAGIMKVVYSFKDGDIADKSCGYQPSATLVRDSAGRLFGTTFFGGSGEGGVIFRLTNDGSGEWTCKALISFVKKGGFRRFGHSPFGGLLLNPVDNMLYGTAQGGGRNNAGVIFRLSLNGKNYRVLYNFAKTGSGGYGPAGALAADANGVMYGTTFFGGNGGGGTVYRIKVTGRFKALHQFSRGSGKNGTRLGYQPTQGPLLIDGTTIYGATTLGGCPQGDTNTPVCTSPAATPGGVLFSLTTAGGNYQVLHTFDVENSAGYGPYGGLVMRSTGQIYGVAQFGGTDGGGVAFRFANGKYTVLHNFVPEEDGYVPSGGLVLDSSNRLIGTNFLGGGDRGTLFRLQP